MPQKPLRREEIEKRAKRLLAASGVKQAPVDVDKIAAHLGISIEQADLGEDCSGILVRRGGRATIGVNWEHHENRQRFSVAHEIGHHELHEGDTYVDAGFRLNFRDLESGSGRVREEREANAFAAALLMPAAWVRREFKAHAFALDDDSDLQELADNFKVSTQAMAIRLGNLRLSEM